MASVSYGCTALVGTNKVGKLKCDENGYYEVILGAFDYPNSTGDIYPLAPAKKLLEESGSLMRRLRNGQLRGELGHPRKEPGMTQSQYLARILQIHEDKVSFHIKEIRLCDKSVKNKAGKYIPVVYGKIKPCGPHGPALKAQLENPDENVAFSIRSLTRDTIVGGRKHKNLTNIVVWDQVNEPGLDIATKYDNPALENLAETTFTDSAIEGVERAVATGEVSLESSGVDIIEVRTALGVQRVTNLSSVSAKW